MLGTLGSNRGGKSTKAKMPQTLLWCLQGRICRITVSHAAAGAPTVFGLRTPLIPHVLVFKKILFPKSLGPSPGSSSPRFLPGGDCDD